MERRRLGGTDLELSVIGLGTWVFGGRWGGADDEASLAVVRRDAKYVLYPEWGYEQLFDLRSDPTELRNLAAEPGSRVELEGMRRKLAEMRERAR